MSRNRYVGDYRLVDSVDERGRIRTSTEYIGGDYSFALGADTARKAGRKTFMLCCAGWIAFVVTLAPVSYAGKALYVILPFVFSAVPLGMLTVILLETIRAREPFEHRLADRLENRYPACGFFHVTLAGIATLAQAIRGIAGGSWLMGDWVFLLAGAASVAVGVLLFRRRVLFKCEKRQKNEPQKESSSAEAAAQVMAGEQD